MRQEGESCKSKKIVFMGTPEISTFALKALIDKGYDIVAIVTQPDKPSGRKKTVVFSDVKKFAIEKNITYYQPEKISLIKDELTKLNPYAFITCAYGQFIPDSILSIPTFGCVNVHASLLPKYRGGAPIHWAIINGETETGITLMQTIKQMDAGLMYSDRKIKIDDSDTTTTLFKKMNKLVYEIVFEDIEKILNKDIVGIPQDESKVSYAFNIKKEQEKVDFNKPSLVIRNLIRGLSDQPGAYCLLNDKKIKIFNIDILDEVSKGNPGTIIDANKKGLIVSTTDKNILIKEIQLEGKKRMFFKDILNGNHPFLKGQILN